MQFKDLERRKNFFDSFAIYQGFDPLIPENWYPIRSNQIMVYFCNFYYIIYIL